MKQNKKGGTHNLIKSKSVQQIVFSEIIIVPPCRNYLKNYC
jgi:hypothetical protein